jgi:Epoxide hydrolase N terminus
MIMGHEISVELSEHRHLVAGMSRRKVIQMGVAAAAAYALRVGFAGMREVAAVATTTARTTVTPFRVTVPQAALDDLKWRLDRARWPERETEEGWSQGVPLDRLRRLVEYWRTGYNWRRFEAQNQCFPSVSH